MIKAIVTDIEGTTSALSFVHEVLFPYARERMAGFIRAHAEDPRVVSQLNDARLAAGAELSIEELIDRLIAWMDSDKKITPLKALQGMIWEAGFKQGDFTGHVYDDALQNLKRWHEAGIKLYVFSSGSVQAQKLLFSYSDAGDLTPLFSAYFDTRIGAKREASAYTAIANKIGLPTEAILFLSDIEQELDAARAAGMHTIWLVRESRPDETAAHRQVQSFDDIVLD